MAGGDKMTQKNTPRINPKKVALAAPKTKQDAQRQIASMLRQNAEAMRALA